MMQFFQTLSPFSKFHMWPTYVNYTTYECIVIVRCIVYSDINYVTITTE